MTTTTITVTVITIIKERQCKRFNEMAISPDVSVHKTLYLYCTTMS